jgi:hypothetical protein
MNLNQLYNILLSGWEEQTKTQRIKSDDFRDSPPSKLLQHFSGGTILIEDAKKPVLSDDKIKTEEGQLQVFLNITNVGVQTEFWIDETGTPQCSLRFNKQGADYKLSQSFTVLDQLSIDALDFHSPVFVLDTLPSKQEEENVNLQQKYSGFFYDSKYEDQITKGLHFEGEVILPEALEWLKLFSSQDSFHADGAIDTFMEVPRLCLETETFNPIQLGHLELSFCLQVLCLYKMFGNREGTIRISPNTFYRIYAVLQYRYATDKQLRLPLDAFIYGNQPNIVVLEADTKEIAELALDNFSKLMCNINFLEWIPADFPVFNAVLLERLYLISSTEKIKLLEIGCSFGLNDKLSDFVVIPDILSINNFKIEFSIKDPMGAPNITASIKGIAAIQGISANESEFSAILYLSKSKDEIAIDFSVELMDDNNINITDFINRLLPYPIGIPQVECTGLSISGSTSPMEFSFSTNLSSTIEISVLFATIKEFDLYFKYKSEEGKTSILPEDVHLYGSVNLFDNIDIHLCASLSKNGWRFEGAFRSTDTQAISISSLLPGTDLYLIPEEIAGIKIISGSIIMDTANKLLEISAVAEANIQFGELGEVEGKHIKFHFESLDKWELTAQGKIKLLKDEQDTYLIDIGGTLKICKDADKFGISYISDPDSGYFREIPLLIPYKVENGNVELSSMNFQIVELKINKEKGWHFESDIKLVFTKLSDIIQKVLPANLEVLLSVDSGTKEAAMQLKDSFLDIIIPSLKLPAVGDIPALEIGEARLTLNNMKLVLNSNMAEVEIEIKYYLPSGLNDIFGVDQQGRPKVVIFDTYGQGNKYLGINFYGKTESGKFDIGFQLSELPIAFVKSESEDKMDYWAISLGPDTQPDKYGSIWLEKPVFELNTDKGGFKASGGFLIKKDPAIPLDLLKRLLEYANLKDVAGLLPQELPIPFSNPPKFIVDGKLNVKLIEDFFPNSLPQQIIDALEEIASLVDKLPEAFLDYMNVEIPKELHFKIYITADGGIDISLSAKPDGIKILLLTPPSLFITGIKLREFSFGEILSGQIFKLRIDADIDSFDILTLAASVISDEKAQYYIGNPKKYRSKIELHNILVLIFYQAGFPIPIPLFCDKVGIDYYGIGDFSLKTSFGLPEPSFNIKEIGGMFNDLIKFVSKPEFHLDPQKKYQDFDIKLILGPNYIKTGNMLGARLIGQEAELKLSLYETVAYLLNAIKFFDLESFIRSIDIKYRFGLSSYSLSFLCINMTADWIISTPNEFITENGYEKLNIDASKTNKFMEILPRRNEAKPITKDDKGIILFLNGVWNTTFTCFEAAFGLIALDTKRFSTGFYLTGRISDLLDLSLLATVKIDPPTIPFQIYGQGKTKFSIANIPVFEGKSSVNAEAGCFIIDGSFSLLDENSPVYIKSSDNMGGLLNNEVITLSGGIKAGILIFQAGGSITVSNCGIEGSFEFIRTISFGITLYNNTLCVNGTLPLSWTDFTYDVRIQHDGSTDADFTSATILNLTDMKLSFTNMLLKTDANGTLIIRILGGEIFSGTVNIKDDIFEANGKVSLFPQGCPFNIIGEVKGWISNSGYSLSGNIQTIIGILSYNGSITIDSTGIKGSFIDGFKHTYTFGLKIYCGKLYIYGEYPSCTGQNPYYIDDQFPYLHTSTPPWGSISDINQIEECTHPYSISLFKEALVMLMQTYFTMDSTAVSRLFEDEALLGLYHFTIDILEHTDAAAGNDQQQYEMTAARQTDGEDFFTELKAELQKNGVDYDINIKDAKIALTSAATKNNRAVMTLYLPNEDNVALRAIEVKYYPYNPIKVFSFIGNKIIKLIC